MTEELITIEEKKSPPKRRRRRDRILVALTLLVIAVVWVAGAIRSESEYLPCVQLAFPGAEHFVKEEDGLYSAWWEGSKPGLLGYVVIGSGDGYGGPMRVAVAVDRTGETVGVVIAGHGETTAWMTRVLRSDLQRSLIGKSYSDPFEIGADIDGVTGATTTSRALAWAVRDGSRAAALRLDLPVDPPRPPKIVFGIPEIVLLALFAVGYIGHQGRFRFARQARWGSMLVGLVVLGFIYNAPLTLASITKFTLGYWPQWQTNLYWYFLIGGILLVFTIDNKNPYCRWFCPFGAAQECMAAIGGAKARVSRRLSDSLKWVPRLLALGAVVVGIYYRSPGLASYEVFGTLFELLGSNIQFVALGLVLIASLFVLRPWCNYLCPIAPVVDLIRVIREMVKEPWRKRKNKPV